MDQSRSFDAYVTHRGQALFRIAYLLTGDHHHAQDLVQQALLKVVGRWRRLAADGDPDPYVRRVLYTEHVGHWRRSKRTVSESGFAPPAGAEPVTADGTDDLVTSLALRRALGQLAPRQRAVIVLRYFEDLTEAQTAELLGIRVGTVKSQARDALARLRELVPDLIDDRDPTREALR
jgi:RNA polymerase sigma-70 factor (sigma-E family)